MTGTVRETGVDACDVAIVGAGIAGLSAAFELQRRGLTVRVLEAASRPGGVITTEPLDGWVIDGGPDSILVHKPVAVQLCRELGIARRLVSTLPPRTAYVLRRSRLHPITEGSFLGFPVTAGGLLRSRLFSPAGRLRMAVEPLVPPRRTDTDESIASFVRRRFGREAVEYLAEPLLAGIHAGDVDRLSMRALFPKLVEAERTAGSILRAAKFLRATPASEGAFVSLPGGTGELISALEAALSRGTLICDSEVKGVWREGAYRLQSTTGALDARSVLLAVPAYAAGSLVRALDGPLADLCEAIPYASTATVAFGYRRDQVAHPLSGTGFLVPRCEGRALLAGTWVSSKWPGRCPRGHVLLRAFLGGGRDPTRLEATDAELVETARSELSDLLGLTGAPVLTRLFRWTRRSPQYEVGHLERLADIERRLARLPGLFVAGSGFKAIGIPDCIADGRAAAALAAEYVRVADASPRPQTR